MYYGPNNLALGDLSIDVSVKLPKSLTTVLKQVPDIRQELKTYATDITAVGNRADATAESWTVSAETIAVGVGFAVIIAALLMREKKSK